MILTMAIICITIVVCFIIRYSAIVHCQNIEYRIYQDLHKKELASYGVRPYFYNGGEKRESFWGYVVYDEMNDCIYKGADKDNTNFIIYRREGDAEIFAAKVRKMHGL